MPVELVSIGTSVWLSFSDDGKAELEFWYMDNKDNQEFLEKWKVAFAEKGIIIKGAQRWKELPRENLVR